MLVVSVPSYCVVTLTLVQGVTEPDSESELRGTLFQAGILRRLRLLLTS